MIYANIKDRLVQMRWDKDGLRMLDNNVDSMSGNAKISSDGTRGIFYTNKRMRLNYFDSETKRIEEAQGRFNNLVVIPKGNADKALIWMNQGEMRKVDLRNGYRVGKDLGTVRKESRSRDAADKDKINIPQSVVADRNGDFYVGGNARIGTQDVGYNNLRPGTYRFMVKAASSYSGWSEPTEITVSITPAPWASWWAYCLYVLAVLGLGSAFFIVTRNRMRTQKKLELSEINRKKSEELSHTKLQFFTNITHELMTPLTIIIAAVEELKAEEPERKQYDFITENAMRLMRLIQQILEFRKAESGNLKLKVVKGDITAFVRNCVVAFRPLADKKKISYRFVQVAKAPIVGCFDSDKLDKILYNLLSNAAKYNREGGSVTVSADADITGRSLVLKVSDTGEGMSREQMEHLFQRFYDGDYRRHNY